jgi:hypothetical protein
LVAEWLGFDSTVIAIRQAVYLLAIAAFSPCVTVVLFDDVDLRTTGIQYVMAMQITYQDEW